MVLLIGPRSRCFCFRSTVHPSRSPPACPDVVEAAQLPPPGRTAGAEWKRARAAVQLLGVVPSKATSRSVFASDGAMCDRLASGATLPLCQPPGASEGPVSRRLSLTRKQPGCYCPFCENRSSKHIPVVVLWTIVTGSSGHRLRPPILVTTEITLPAQLRGRIGRELSDCEKCSGGGRRSLTSGSAARCPARS